MPASGTRQRHLRRVLRRQARRLHRERPDLATILGGGRPPSAGREPVENVERRAVSAALDTKLRDAGPLFEAQILLRGAGETDPQAKAAVDRLLAAFAPTASARNWLRASGLPAAGPRLPRLRPPAPPAELRPPPRLRAASARRGGASSRRGRSLGFLKPPTEDCVAENILRCGPAPAEAARAARLRPEEERADPARADPRTSAARAVAGVRAADSIFTYIAGRSRFGKTELAISQFVHLVRAGHGGLFLDPHGDALDRIRPYLTEPEVARRVVEIDVGPGTAGRPQPGWNLFELRGAEPGESEARVEGVVDAFASALGWGERSTRAINLDDAGGRRAGDDRAGPRPGDCADDLPDPDASHRRGVARGGPALPAEERPQLLDRPVRSPLRRGDDAGHEHDRPAARLDARRRRCSARARASYRSRDAMDQQPDRPLLPRLWRRPGSAAREPSRLRPLPLGRAEGEVAAGSRRPFFVCLDEVQTFDGGQTKLPALIEETAKFGLRGIFYEPEPGSPQRRDVERPDDEPLASPHVEPELLRRGV